jgi:hypothetical protein
VRYGLREIRVEELNGYRLIGRRTDLRSGVGPLSSQEISASIASSRTRSEMTRLS